MPVGVFVPIKLEERLHARHARLEEAACGLARDAASRRSLLLSRA